MRRVGLIVNPNSGKDIRRIVGGGTTASYQDKVDLARQIIVGLLKSDVEEILMLEDPTGMSNRILSGLRDSDAGIAKVIDMRSDGTAEDTDRAVDEIGKKHCGCIITVGGDGTNRRVSRRCKQIPLLPLPGGTNNVFCEHWDGLVAGLAAGTFLKSGHLKKKLSWRSKRLIIESEGKPVNDALIDVVVSNNSEIGTKAIWEPESLNTLVLSQGLPTSIGLSAIGGMLEPIGPREEGGLHVTIHKSGRVGYSIIAGILPAVMAEVKVKDFDRLNIGDVVDLPSINGTLAMDGERELVMRRGEKWTVRLQDDGPWRLDVDCILREAVKRNWLTGFNEKDARC